MANQNKFLGNKESNGNRSRDKPPILLKVEIKSYKKEDCVVIKCCSDPKYLTSTTYTLFIPMFKDENPEKWLKWVKNAKQAAKGQNITTRTAKFARAKRPLDGGALIAFK